MKDVRFYLEYPSKTEKNKATVKNPGNHKGTCLAVLHKDYWVNGKDIIMECVSAVQDTPNGMCAGTSCSQGYLNEPCKRIPERLAMEIHLNLFVWLE